VCIVANEVIRLRLKESKDTSSSYKTLVAFRTMSSFALPLRLRKYLAKWPLKLAGLTAIAQEEHNSSLKSL
jgi:hypothetical protein